MAQSDLRTFLQDLLLRFQPDIDLSTSSRAQVELIEPIITRIGLDPFDTDIATFVKSRVSQMFPNLAIEETQAIEDTLINPMQVLLEPIVREIKLAKLRQGGVANVESLSDEEVDSLMGNFFEARQSGGYARGTIRVWFLAPQTVTFSLIQVAATRSGLRFIPQPTQTISAALMALNRDGSEYYVDITYRAENRGDEYNIDRNEIVSISNLPAAARIRNLNRFQGGLPRETSPSFVGRVETTLSDRTLTVQRGILSELNNNFPAIRSTQVIGMKDPEMRRDIVKGGSLGDIRADDSFGSAYGAGTAVDDGNGDTTTRRISAADGHFVSRIGSAGTTPDGYFITLVYGSPPVFRDVRVTDVISDTDILVDYEIPSFPLAVSWALRKKELTISDIPGGITLPDTPEGELVITSDEIHIGGKTDVYIAGATSAETVAIEGLSDESPLAMGFDAETAASPDPNPEWIVINDPPGGAAALYAAISEGTYSIVLSEGSDVGSYAIRDAQVVGTTVEVRVPIEMTGTQGSLSWKIVDEIDVELTEPKDIRVEGSDMIFVAGNMLVTTLSSTNFIDANVQQNDTLRVEGDGIGGDYNIDAVGPVQLTISPTPERTVLNVKYTIFRAGEAVLAPIVRVKELELLDSGGAPNGVKIPYRDPVVVMTRGFQNEGSGLTYEGFPDRIGLVTGALGATVDFGAGATLIFNFRSAERPYAGNTLTYTLNLVGTLTLAEILDEINTASPLITQNVLASLLSYNDQSFIGIYCPSWLELDMTGTANALLGFSTADRASTNIEIVIATHNPREGDLVEFVDGNNRGTTRVMFGHKGARTSFIVGSGPVSEFSSPMYAVTPLLPEVGVRIRVGRPSVGSARVYFLAPTSAEFHYNATRLTALVGTDLLEYRPDPENQRIIQPAQPLTELPKEGTTSPANDVTAFRDLTVNFQALGIRSGDILEVLYRPIRSAFPLASPGTLSVAGTTLIVRMGENPWITISFSVPLTREDVADFINEQVGETIASIDGGGYLVLEGDTLITLRADSTVLAGPDPLELSTTTRSTAHPRAGHYIITDVDTTALLLSPDTVFSSMTAVSSTAYRILRHVQRISSTEMNDNQDGTGLYYVDVELLSLAPGDRNNAPGNLSMEISGHRSDGYRLYADNDTLSYSRAERLFAEISRTILLVGSSDSPEEYVQLSRQNVQVSYNRSQLVDDVQSFCDSDQHRVVVEEILARHLLPHYVNLAWRYVGGETEVSMRAALTAYLDGIGPEDELEIVDMTKIVTMRGANSIYTMDSESPTGRSAPVLVIVYHTVDRKVRALIVRDFAKTSRTQRFIADNLAIVRAAPTGLRA